MVKMPGIRPNVFPKGFLPPQVQVGVDNLNSEYNEGKENLAGMFGKGVPLDRRFSAGQKAWSQAQRLAPIARSAATALRGKNRVPGQQQQQSTQPQATSQSSKRDTRTVNAQKTSTQPTKAPNLGASPRAKTAFGNSFNKFEQLNGFNVMNTNGVPTSMSSVTDDSLYENPYVFQSEPQANSAIKVRTVYNLLSPTIFDSATSLQIFDELFIGWKTQVNEGTNGGTAVTKDVFVPEKVKNYLKTVYALHFRLVELISRMAWATEDINSNKVLRNFAYSLTNDVRLLTMRNRMASVLSNYVLPMELYNYPYWLLQVNQTNEFRNCIDQLFMTPEMATCIEYDNIDNYLLSLTNEINSFTNQNQAEASQISALFQAKTSNNWVNLRNIKSPTNTTVYDPYWNDIFNNTSTMSSAAGDIEDTYTYPPAGPSKDTTPIVFSTDINDIQVHVTERFLQRYAGETALLFTDQYLLQAPEPLTYKKYNNKFLLFQDVNKTCGITSMVRAQHITQVGNDAVTLYKTNPMATYYDYSIKPVGDQYYLYDVSYNALILAQRLFAAKIFA